MYERQRFRAAAASFEISKMFFSTVCVCVLLFLSERCEMNERASEREREHDI